MRGEGANSRSVRYIRLRSRDRSRRRARLDVAAAPRDLDLQGLRRHALKGDRAGQRAVSVSGRWRIVFRFADGHAHGVTLIDYH
ncbi:MAG: peptidase [Alphaproteobacteria bacterium]|nr:peptidase [Alphaproteobacteria bacterium]